MATVNASSYFTNIQIDGDIGVPIGSTIETSLNNPSQLNSDKWLMCDGRVVNKADYPELFNIIGHGCANYKISDEVDTSAYNFRMVCPNTTKTAFVAVSADTTKLYSSTDMINWTLRLTMPTNQTFGGQAGWNAHIVKIIWDDATSKFYISVAWRYTLSIQITNCYGALTVAYSSSDGSTWTAISYNFPSTTSNFSQNYYIIFNIKRVKDYLIILPYVASSSNWATGITAFTTAAFFLYSTTGTSFTYFACTTSSIYSTFNVISIIYDIFYYKGNYYLFSLFDGLNYNYAGFKSSTLISGYTPDSSALIGILRQRVSATALYATTPGLKQDIKVIKNGAAEFVYFDNQNIYYEYKTNYFVNIRQRIGYGGFLPFFYNNRIYELQSVDETFVLDYHVGLYSGNNLYAMSKLIKVNIYDFNLLNNSYQPTIKTYDAKYNKIEVAFYEYFAANASGNVSARTVPAIFVEDNLLGNKIIFNTIESKLVTIGNQILNCNNKKYFNISFIGHTANSDFYMMNSSTASLYNPYVPRNSWFNYPPEYSSFEFNDKSWLIGDSGIISLVPDFDPTTEFCLPTRTNTLIRVK